MDHRFEFDGADVLPLLEESEKAKERLWTEAQRLVAAGVDLSADEPPSEAAMDAPETGAPPGLWLMNDRGVYLRSNARGRPGERVAYARGFRADVPVGDEPIWEFLDAAPLRQLRPDDTLVVSLSERRVRLSLVRTGGAQGGGA